MIQFGTEEAFWSAQNLTTALQLIQQRIALNPGEKMDKMLCQEVSRLLEPAESVATKFNILDAQKTITRLRAFLGIGGGRLVAETKADLQSIQVAFHGGLRDICFAYVPRERIEFFENDVLFGKEVYQAFPSARPEIKSVGTCIVAELHTAAIFHLMRAAEIGMRVLAKHLKVKVKKIKKAKMAITCPRCGITVSAATIPKSALVPLDYAMWEEVLVALENKIKDTQKTRKGRDRDLNYEFYHGLILELNAFKDLWRNPVCHCRRDFKWPHVVQAYSDVRDFMKRLASKVSEK